MKRSFFSRRTRRSSWTQRGIVERPQDELLDVEQAGGVLPAAGLVAPDEAAQDAPVADRVVGPADRGRVEPGHGHVLLDEPDVVVVLDEVLRDPGRHPVALGPVGEGPARRRDRVARDPVVGIGAQDLDLVPPFGRRELGEVGVREPELAHVLEVLDRGVEAEQRRTPRGRSRRRGTCRDGTSATGGRSRAGGRASPGPGRGACALWRSRPDYRPVRPEGQRAAVFDFCSPFH